MQRNNEFFKQVDCDITIFESYSNEINDIFSSYLETLTSVITIYEVLTGEFPRSEERRVGKECRL